MGAKDRIIGNSLGKLNELKAIQSSTILISIDEIIPDPNNREEMGDIADFAFNEIKPVGTLIHNIAVWKNGDKYQLISGERRWRGFHLLRDSEPEQEKARWSKIQANLMNITNQIDADIAAKIANIGQRNYSEHDKARIALELKQALEKKKDSGVKLSARIAELIAEELKITERQARTYLNYAENVGDDLKELVKGSKLTMTVAEKFAKLDDGTQSAIADIIKSGVTIKSEDAGKIIQMLKGSSDSKENNKQENTSSSKKVNKIVTFNFNKVNSNLKKCVDFINNYNSENVVIDNKSKETISEIKAAVASLTAFLAKLEK